MKKTVIAILYVMIGTVIGIIMYALADTHMSKQDIEAIQIEYYTYGFSDGQECEYITRTGIVKGIRLVDTLPIAPEWVNLDTLLMINDTSTVGRYKYYRITFVGNNDSLPISPDRMQEILDAEIVTTYPRYSEFEIGGSK